jgi:hypothetical protein
MHLVPNSKDVPLVRRANSGSGLGYSRLVPKGQGSCFVAYTVAMQRYAALVVFLVAACSAAPAQWQIENSGTTADLRGIDNAGGGVAWASGTNGTVLRTEDGGYLWQNCAIPSGAEHLDFRGIQAFDANTAIVMSSGKGDLSRLYKTTDGCQTWKLVFTNPDKDGFWDGISFGASRSDGMLIGDAVGHSFPIFLSSDKGESWKRWSEAQAQKNCKKNEATALKGENLFAASNQSAIEFVQSYFLFVTGGVSGPRFFYADSHEPFDELGGSWCWIDLSPTKLPLAGGSSSAGAFALAVEDTHSYFPFRIMIVGGDYRKPGDANGTAVFLTSKNGFHLPFTSYFDATVPSVPPQGFRSAVAFDAASKTWVTVGPNGTDISTDDGKNWRALHPDAAMHEAPDADRNWNALSLPYVVGPHGRIGKLDPHALTGSQH